MSDADSVLKATPSKTQQIIQNISTISTSSSSSAAEDDEIGDGLKTIPLQPTGKLDSLVEIIAQDNQCSMQLALCNTASAQLARTSSLPWIPGQVERRRRKLPEIPKNRKCK